MSNSITSDLPPPVKEIGMLQMNDPRSPFLYDAVNSKKSDPPSIRAGEFIVQNADLAKKLGILKETLQKELPGVEISVTHFQNWGTTISSLLLYVKPKTREDVCNIIKSAKTHKIKVGMGGAYHSWSPTYPDPGGILINICDLVLPSNLEDDSWTSSRMRLNQKGTHVTIAPGVTTGELMQFFLDKDVCFKSDVVLAAVTYGGVFSGGCHGVGKSQTSLSDWITSLTVVDGNGDIKVIPEDYSDIDPVELLKAASAGLGLFGVILEVTVKVKPMVHARVKNVFSHKLSLLKDDNISELKHLIKENESLEMFWFPFNSIFDKIGSKNKDGKLNFFKGIEEKEIVNGRVIRVDDGIDPWCTWNPWNDDLWSREINFTEDKVTQDPGIPVYSMILDVIAGGAMSISKAIFGSMSNKFTPLTLALGFKMLKLQYGVLQSEEVVKVPWAIHYRDAVDLYYAYDMEFAIPIDIDNPVVLNKAVKVVVDLTYKYSIKGLFFGLKGVGNAYPLNLCLEFRIIKKSEALLCPASIGDQKHILYIEVLSIVNTSGVHDYFEEIANGWKALGGVPHWQKQWTFLDKDGSMIDYLKKMYGDNRTKFKDMLTTANVDPENMFINNVYKQFLAD